LNRPDKDINAINEDLSILMKLKVTNIQELCNLFKLFKK